MRFKNVNNDLFAENSWYFRNALVRANYEDLSKGVHKTEKYLLRFLTNLLLKENHLLSNREMHVQFTDPVNDPVKANYNELAEKTGYSVATIKRHIQELKKPGIIERIGSDKTGHWRVTEK